jgi:hypothetical protein
MRFPNIRVFNLLWVGNKNQRKTNFIKRGYGRAFFSDHIKIKVLNNTNRSDK